MMKSYTKLFPPALITGTLI